MSTENQAKPAYPRNKEDIENEKQISEALSKLTPAGLKLKAFAINHNLLKLKDLENKEQDEISIVDAKGGKTFEPNQAHMSGLIAGSRVPTTEELGDLSVYFTAEELEKKEELLKNLKPLPNYWLTVFKNHGLLKSALSERDEEAIKSLTKVEYKLSEDPAHPLNFSISFHFATNEFFENEVLTANLHVTEPREVSKIEGTELKWKEGKDLTKKTVQKKQRNKKTGQTRTITKTEDCDSFFGLFKTLENKEEEPHDHKEGEECSHKHKGHKHDDDEDDEHGHDENEELYDNVEVAYSLYEEVIPYNLEYFLGVRKDEGEEDEDYDDEDGGDDDDDDEPQPKAKKDAKPKPGATGDAAGGAKPQECKQQ